MSSFRRNSAAAILVLIGVTSSTTSSFSFAPTSTATFKIQHRTTLYRPKLVTSRSHVSNKKPSRTTSFPRTIHAAIDNEDDEAKSIITSTSTTTNINSDESKDPPLFEPFFRGIRRDYQMRLPLYKSDIADGLNAQCLAATLFLFFACIAPAVGFGSLFGMATHGAIGTMEMVSSMWNLHIILTLCFFLIGTSLLTVAFFRSNCFSTL